MKALNGRCLTLLTTGLLAVCLNLGAHSAQGSTPLIVNNSNSPHAKLKSLPVDSVQWTDGFWKERFEQNATVTLRRLWELADDPEKGHVLDNFRIAAGERQGERQGTHWQDAWLYKWIEAAAVTWRIAEDPWIAEKLEESIRLVEKAQQEDGYLATQTTLPGWGRFQDEQHHEAYTMGHLITAGVIHQRMTGDDTLFKVAKRTADYLCRVLGNSVSPSFAHNPSAIMGLAELYRDADALFLPLLDSTANNTLLEGIASGLPVVATDLASIRAYVRGDASLLVQDDDIDGYVAALSLLHVDRDQRDARGLAARARAEMLAWPVVAAQHAALYRAARERLRVLPR